MRIRFLLFALYRDIAGSDEFELVLPEGMTALDAVNALRAGRPALENLPARPVVAINRTYAALEETLRDGDELALLPPVAGG